MSKFRMELNGVANLLALLEMAQGGFGCDCVDQDEQEAWNNLKPQVELLERYMLAFSDAINKGEQPPYWHEVRDNPSKYPRNNGR